MEKLRLETMTSAQFVRAAELAAELLAREYGETFTSLEHTEQVKAAAVTAALAILQNE